MARNSLPWFPFFASDFLTSETVRLLSNAELGAYIRLLCHQWIEGTIPADRVACLELAQVTPEEFDDLNDCWTTVQRLFNGRSADDQRMFNLRLQEIRIEQAETHDKRVKSARQAGLASAESRNNQPHKAKQRRVDGSSTIGRSTSVNHTESEVDTDTKGPTTTAPLIPEWIPAPIWAEWLAHRKAKRAKPTPHAVELMLKDLAAWRAKGQDPIAVIEQAIKKGWTGLRELESSDNGNGQFKTRLEREFDELDRRPTAPAQPGRPQAEEKHPRRGEAAADDIPF